MGDLEVNLVAEKLGWRIRHQRMRPLEEASSAAHGIGSKMIPGTLVRQQKEQRPFLHLHGSPHCGDTLPLPTFLLSYLLR